jgi:hypothetical protein
VRLDVPRLLPDDEPLPPDHGDDVRSTVKRDGHLFKGRYGAYLIESEEHLAAARECILANPVRAGLCAGVADWPWSGCPSLFSARS